MRRPCVVVIIDTLTYLEAIRMHRLLSGRPCTWHSCHWGMSPFTLPAMITMVTGMGPEQHGMWRHWRPVGNATSVQSLQELIGNKSMGFDWRDGGARAVTGGGFAAGDQWGYGKHFDWQSYSGDGRTPALVSSVEPRGLTLLHTYHVHHYVRKVPNDEVTRILQREPWAGVEKRRGLIHEIENELIDLIDFWSGHDVWVTSDHGEGFSPSWSCGHCPGALPTEELLHLPLIQFGPDITESSTDERFTTHDQLRGMVRGDVEYRKQVGVFWQWGRDGELHRRFDLTPNGIILKT